MPLHTEAEDACYYGDRDMEVSSSSDMISDLCDDSCLCTVMSRGHKEFQVSLSYPLGSFWFYFVRGWNKRTGQRPLSRSGGTFPRILHSPVSVVFVV